MRIIVVKLKGPLRTAEMWKLRIYDSFIPSDSFRTVSSCEYIYYTPLGNTWLWPWKIGSIHVSLFSFEKYPQEDRLSLLSLQYTNIHWSPWAFKHAEWRRQIGNRAPFRNEKNCHNMWTHDWHWRQFIRILQYSRRTWSVKDFRRRVNRRQLFFILPSSLPPARWQAPSADN